MRFPCRGVLALPALIAASLLFAACAEEEAPVPAAATKAADEAPGRGVPMFRGSPARSGVSPGPAVQRSPELLWRFKTGAEVSSSPAVIDGVVYIGSNDGNVYALDAATGKERWRFQTGGWVLSSPAVVGGVVYIGSYDSYVYALDAATGKERWRFRTGNSIVSSPAVVSGLEAISKNLRSPYTGAHEEDRANG
jgi:hypothetical protein